MEDFPDEVKKSAQYKSYLNALEGIKSFPYKKHSDFIDQSLDGWDDLIEDVDKSLTPDELNRIVRISIKQRTNALQTKRATAKIHTAFKDSIDAFYDWLLNSGYIEAKTKGERESMCDYLMRKAFSKVNLLSDLIIATKDLIDHIDKCKELLRQHSDNMKTDFRQEYL